MNRHGLLAVIYAATLYGLILTCTVSFTWAQQPAEAVPTALTLSSDFEVTPNITYLTANGYQAKLDVYQPVGENSHPTLIYFHGGGWVAGNKEAAILEVVPFLEKGWAVVNVEYC